MFGVATNLNQTLGTLDKFSPLTNHGNGAVSGDGRKCDLAARDIDGSHRIVLSRIRPKHRAVLPSDLRLSFATQMKGTGGVFKIRIPLFDPGSLTRLRRTHGRM